MKPLSLAILLSLAACGAPFTTSADAPIAPEGDAGGVDVLELLALDAAARPPAADTGGPELDAGDAGEVLEHLEHVDAGDAQGPLDGSIRVDTGTLDAGVDAEHQDAPAPVCDPSTCAVCTLGASPCCTPTGCGCYQFNLCR
jgi:hypothetical protein